MLANKCLLKFKCLVKCSQLHDFANQCLLESYIVMIPQLTYAPPLLVGLGAVAPPSSTRRASQATGSCTFLRHQTKSDLRSRSCTKLNYFIVRVQLVRCAIEESCCRNGKSSEEPSGNIIRLLEQSLWNSEQENRTGTSVGFVRSEKTLCFRLKNLRRLPVKAPKAWGGSATSLVYSCCDNSNGSTPPAPTFGFG